MRKLHEQTGIIIARAAYDAFEFSDTLQSGYVQASFDVWDMNQSDTLRNDADALFVHDRLSERVHNELVSLGYKW